MDNGSFSPVRVHSSRSLYRAFLAAQWPRSHLPVEGTWVQCLGWEDPLEEEMATLSSIPAWRFPRTEEPGGPQSMGLQSQAQLSDYTRARAHTHTHTLLVDCPKGTHTHTHTSRRLS